MAEVTLTKADLGAAVAAGRLSEAQAAALVALAQARAGRRAAMAADDEPFELYRGFNDVFVTIGLIILLVGLGFFAPETLSLFGGDPAGGALANLSWAVFMALLLWGLGEYFTGQRRMVAPSMALVLHLGYSLGGGGLALAVGVAGLDDVAGLAVAFLAAALGAIGFYLRFGLPFAMLPAGGALLAAAITAAGLMDAAALDRLDREGIEVLLDLGAGTTFPLVTLVFGLGVFALAMRHDIADPHRVTRRAACGFWLHLLAAPAIVNTAAFSLYAGGGWAGMAGLALFLAAMTLVALVIDRRSFLLAAAGYMAALLLAGLGEQNIAVVLIFLGMLILGLGAGWTGLRARAMRALPAFPGKDRLPPWTGSIAEAAP